MPLWLFAFFILSHHCDSSEDQAQNSNTASDPNQANLEVNRTTKGGRNPRFHSLSALAIELVCMEFYVVGVWGRGVEAVSYSIAC